MKSTDIQIKIIGWQRHKMVRHLLLWLMKIHANISRNKDNTIVIVFMFLFNIGRKKTCFKIQLMFWMDNTYIDVEIFTYTTVLSAVLSCWWWLQTMSTDEQNLGGHALKEKICHPPSSHLPIFFFAPSSLFTYFLSSPPVLQTSRNL